MEQVHLLLLCPKHARARMGTASMMAILVHHRAAQCTLLGGCPNTEVLKRWTSEPMLRLRLQPPPSKLNRPEWTQYSEDSRDRVRLAEALLAKLRERCFALKSMIAWMKMTSNILEDSVQLVVLTLLICFTRSDTSSAVGGTDTVDVIFEAWFSSNSTNWIPLFALLSLMSLILGHMGLLSANKNGFTTLVGHWFIAFPYFLVSTACRIFSIILFYTPILGLFNTLYHSSRGQIPANSDQWSVENPWYDNSEADLRRNVTNFHETWSKLQIEKDSDFFALPLWVGTVPAFFLVVHIAFGYVFLRRVLGTYEGKLEDIPVDETKSFKCDQDGESENEECPDENTGPETGSLVLAQFVSHFIYIE